MKPVNFAQIAAAVALVTYAALSMCVTTVLPPFFKPADTANGDVGAVAALIWGVVITAPFLFLYFYLPLLVLLAAFYWLFPAFAWASDIAWVGGAILTQLPSMNTPDHFSGALVGG